MPKDSCRNGIWKKQTVFCYGKIDEAGAGGYFTTSQTKTDTPTLSLDAWNCNTMTMGKINRIHYRLKPTNAVTYVLRIWRAARAGDYESNSVMLYESPPTQASDVDYDKGELEIPFVLSTPGTMYYSIEWSGAPGNTVGFIDVTGERVD